MFKLNGYEGLHWQSDWNGYEVGYDMAEVIGLYSRNEIDMYIDPITLEVYEMWNEDEDSLMISPDNTYEFNNWATMEIVNFEDRIWIRNFKKHDFCNEKEVFKKFIKFLDLGTPITIQVTPSLSNTFLYRTLRELEFESDKIVTSESTGEFLIVMHKEKPKEV